jgi:hypothetical protein
VQYSATLNVVDLSNIVIGKTNHYSRKVHKAFKENNLPSLTRATEQKVKIFFLGNDEESLVPKAGLLQENL